MKGSAFPCLIFSNSSSISLRSSRPAFTQMLFGCWSGTVSWTCFYLLDLSLLEVLFVYTFKMSQKERFSLSAHISSLQLVMGLPDSNKNGAMWHILVSGPWSGLYEGLDREFHPWRSLQILSRICSCVLCLFFVACWLWTYYWCFCLCVVDKDKRGQLVEWVEKAYFDQPNTLFKIFAT